jgi:hypothetical protein
MRAAEISRVGPAKSTTVACPARNYWLYPLRLSRSVVDART